MRIAAAVIAIAVLAGCGSTASTTFSTVGDDPGARSQIVQATANPTPGTAMCEAFDVVNDVISPAYSSLAEGVANEEQVASTIEAAASAIDDLAEEEPNAAAAEQLTVMADRFRDDASAVRNGDLGSQRGIDYYLQRVTESADAGTCS